MVLTEADVARMGGSSAPTPAKPRRGCLRGCGWGCGLPIVVVLAIVLLDRLPGLLVGGDALGVRLQQALAGTTTLQYAYQEMYPGSRIAIVPGDVTIEELQRRASQVDGWDTLAVIVPYSSGRKIAGRPGIRWRPSWLSVTLTPPVMQDAIFQVVAIRYGFVVTRFTIYLDGGFNSFVLEHD